MNMHVELLDRLIKAWFAYKIPAPPMKDFLSLPTGADILNNEREPVRNHIEEAIGIVGKLCDHERHVKHIVCLRNQTHGYHIVEGIIDTMWECE